MDRLQPDQTREARPAPAVVGSPDPRTVSRGPEAAWAQHTPGHQAPRSPLALGPSSPAHGQHVPQPDRGRDLLLSENERLYFLF